MKKGIVFTALITLAQPVFGGEGEGLLLNFEENIKNISLTQGVTKNVTEAISRSLQRMKSYIQFSDPKLLQKFLPIEDATKVLCNVAQISFNKFVSPFKKVVESNLFAAPDKKTIQGIKDTIKPLHSELKKVKGSFFSNISLGKKSEAQKVVDGAKKAIVEKIQEILKKFEIIEKTKVIN